MTSNPPITTEIAVLTEQINMQHAEIGRDGECIIWKILDLGDALAEEKKRVGHGDWTAWVAEHYDFTMRTAQRYIAYAAGRVRIEEAIYEKRHSGSFLTLNDARKLLLPPKQKSPSTDGEPGMEAPIETPHRVVATDGIDVGTDAPGVEDVIDVRSEPVEPNEWGNIRQQVMAYATNMGHGIAAGMLRSLAAELEAT